MDAKVTENIEINVTGFGQMQPNECSSLEQDMPTSSQDECLTFNAIGLNTSMREDIEIKESTQIDIMCIGAGLKDTPDLAGVCCRAPSEASIKDIPEFYGSSSIFSNSVGSITHDKRSFELHSSKWNKQALEAIQTAERYNVRDVETSKESVSQGPLQVLRPLGEGRGRNHMLPRYWPRMTEKELQQLITQDSNCKVIPLFEKVLSASDAGKVGRLVLPKACAEAYFPPISQPEGVPLAVQDIIGKEWVFQFRFWPNNNSRMYVLEGITPCIQSMHLQAGDTVIFSRLDPEGKLLLGYRRASNLATNEGNQKPVVPGLTWPARIKSMSSVFSKVSKQADEMFTQFEWNDKFQQYNTSIADNFYKLQSLEKSGFKSQSGTCTESLISEKRKGKDVVPKIKRQEIDAEKVEFRKSWEAVQNLLISPPNVTPTIVTVDGYDFEEYEEPPVLGTEKAYIDCSACLCSEQDLQRGSNNPVLKDDKEGKGSKNDLSLEATGKKDNIPVSTNSSQTRSGLETLASIATAEGNNNDSMTSSATITTKHPRHRPGCSCIVCIQPPSGQGPKHKPNCDCNVCTMVKRRFQTLMLRRKKLQSERTAESAPQKNHPLLTDSSVGERKPNEQGSCMERSLQGFVPHLYPNTFAQSAAGFCKGSGPHSLLQSMKSHLIRSASPNFEQNPTKRPPARDADSNYQQFHCKGAPFDLNSQPDREEDMSRGGHPVSMKSLLLNATYPLDAYLKEQGLTSLASYDPGKCGLDSHDGETRIVKESGQEIEFPAVMREF
ncbi:hypothetical protein KP509_05G007100 [Ceratopteris richardii]|uniref:TF-B3 domain-containing protein n=1 Tax=Ceratopteris richardii TaxID=49495 RepID=A0A8T2URG8_CERRI|nr:hypothetical protein KP509_05G007100 [Ceratopteris richardii]